MNEFEEIKTKLDELKAIKSLDLAEEAKYIQEYGDDLKISIKSASQEVLKTIKNKQIRLLKNVNGYRIVMFQEVIPKYEFINDARPVENEQIAFFGDIYISGGNDMNTSGSGRSPIGWGFSRLAIPAGVEIVDVVGGHASFYAIEKDSNAMWVWGNNSQGCLGLGHNAVVPIPQKVSFQSKIKQVCSKSYTSSYQFCTVLLEDGSVWSAGRNVEGELGIGNTIDSNRFVRINSLPFIKQIFGGNNVVSGTFALDVNGTLWAWGFNGNGCLGLGKNTNVLTPEKHPLKDVIRVFHYSKDNGGYRATTFFQTKEGALYGCGFNGQKQLSQENTADQYTPVQIFVSSPNPEETIFLGGTNLNTCLYLNTNGNVWSWGYGDYGFGDGRAGKSLTKTLNQAIVFKSIASQAYGYPAFYAQDKNGNLWSFGYNNNALGLGHNNNTREWTKLPTPNGIKDYFPMSWYEQERALIATDGKRLYASGTLYNGNLTYSSNVLQPQILPLGVI